MEINANEIYETFAYVVANKYDCRMVVYFKDQPLNETMLVDFSDAGESDFEGGKVCVWSVSRDLKRGEVYCGTEEMDYGSFENYADVLVFLFDTLKGHDVEVVAESF